MSCKEDINYLRVVTLAKSVTYFLTACRARASKHTVPPADQLLKPLASRLSRAERRCRRCRACIYAREALLRRDCRGDAPTRASQLVPSLLLPAAGCSSWAARGERRNRRRCGAPGCGATADHGSRGATSRDVARPCWPAGAAAAGDACRCWLRSMGSAHREMARSLRAGKT